MLLKGIKTSLCKQMGHASAIHSGNVGNDQGKIAALLNAGLAISGTPWDVPILLKKFA